MEYNVFDFSSVNTIKISFWTLSLVLILILIGVIIWRLFFDKNPNNLITNSKNIGAIDKELDRLIDGLSKNKEFEIIYNILIKNKFSKLNYSLIPAIIIYKNRVFLISNMIKNSINDELVINDKEIWLIHNSKKKTLKEVQMHWYNEIIKMLKHDFLPDSKFKFEFIVLLKNDIRKISNNTSFMVSNSIDFIEEIEKNYEAYDELSLNDKYKLVEKLQKENLYKIKAKK
ncbi:hypothetical protein DP067_03805 [Mycoplasmopsis anatis]|uniref:NERD domain-containing protein n=1 Tax=Mycoplasmopsis anatis 1340 TaxID=1034808 RepID=F9QEC0_9BACT|nr:hypothetical protein [Mycoplasmopsis anatis]AWX70451.1 hypothetical protein DP067_03805 [Mycoplasmopsis anatis]EGS28931.1 hypothetical protein GIG_03657 [Mycoplasmopsis anatis 1340]VEU73890.1 Uncharacterised protein [Mycoplasmopsis anatis]